MKYNLLLLANAAVLAAVLYVSVLSPEMSHALPYMRHAILRPIQRELQSAADRLKEYHARHGTYPSNEEGLAALRADFLSNPAASGIDLPSGRNMGLMPARDRMPRHQPLYGEAGLYSKWLVPMLYENRRGLPPAAFASSVVNDDSWRLYSIEVDTGVFVWIPEAVETASNYVLLTWCYRFGIALSALLVIPLLYLLWRSEWFFRLIAAVLIVFPATQALSTMCYSMGLPFAGDRTELLRKQDLLLDQYEINKVLSPETVRKLRERMRRDQERIDALMKEPAGKSGQAGPK